MTVHDANDNDTHHPPGSQKEPGMYEDEDNDRKFPDESPVEVRYPRSKQEQQGTASSGRGCQVPS
jgi:hypothetical protein